jgi:4-amino-4-deoxy-L-arabinose transferase-like glycosyltransferase
MKTGHVALALLIIFSLVLLLRLSFVNEPFERDEGAYATIGQVILNGGVPYRDAVDHKPPGIHYIYALMISLVGEKTASIRILTACYALLSVFSVYRLARYVSGVHAGLLAALLFGVFSSGPVIRGSSSNSEVFMVLPVTLALYFFLQWQDNRYKIYLAGSGALLGLAMIIKTTALPYVVLILAAIAFARSDRQSFKNVLTDAICFLVPPSIMALATIGYFSYRGALQDFLFWNLTFNKVYGKTSLQEFLFILVKKGIPIASEFLPLWVLGIVAVVWIVLKKKDTKHLLLVFFAVASLVAVAMPGKFSPYYFILMIPALSILAAIELVALKGQKFAAFIVVPLALFALVYTAKMDYPFYLKYTPDQVSSEIYGTDAFVSAVTIANYIRERTTPQDYIFQWGWEPELYFLSGRRSPNRFIAPLFIDALENKPIAVQEMIGSLKSRKPVFVVLNRGWETVSGFQELTGILVKDYQMEYKVHDFLVFRLKNTGS